MRKAKRLLTLIVLVLVACAVYYLYRFGWTTPKVSQLGQIFSSSDPAITTNVKSDLGLSRLLAGYDLNVKTDDGVVTIGGQVPSEDLRSLAGEIARQAPGVKDVKNLIIVSPDARAGGGNSRIQDLEIKTALSQSLARSPELGGKKIEISVDNQVVTLTGSVDTLEQRLVAEQIARASAGVSAVNDAIIAGGQPAPGQATPGAAATPAALSNADLAKHVEFELYSTGAFDLSTVSIKADNGAVTLTGTVRSRAEQLLAERVAQGVAGVRSVANELKTAPAATRH